VAYVVLRMWRVDFTPHCQLMFIAEPTHVQVSALGDSGTILAISSSLRDRKVWHAFTGDTTINGFAQQLDFFLGYEVLLL
jgi:hypothetical protein